MLGNLRIKLKQEEAGEAMFLSVWDLFLKTERVHSIAVCPVLGHVGDGMERA